MHGGGEKRRLDRTGNIPNGQLSRDVTQYDLFSLRMFAAVVESSNIAQAAKSNNIAASAVSRRISELENRTGAPLLIRLREGVEPTSAGRVLYDHIIQIGRVLESLDAQMSAFSQGVRGEVRLWANSSAVTQFLPEDLAIYVSSFPQVQILLREDTSSRIADAVRDGASDLGIFSDHIGVTNLESRVYRRDSLMLIVPAAHVLAKKETVLLSETADFEHVALQEGSSIQARVQRAAAEQGFSIRTRVQVFGFDGIRGMVEAGLGVAVLPQGAVLPYLESRNIIAIRLVEPWAERSLRIGFRDYALLSAAGKALVDCLAP